MFPLPEYYWVSISQVACGATFTRTFSFPRYTPFCTLQRAVHATPSWFQFWSKNPSHSGNLYSFSFSCPLLQSFSDAIFSASSVITLIALPVLNVLISFTLLVYVQYCGFLMPICVRIHKSSRLFLTEAAAIETYTSVVISYGGLPGFAFGNVRRNLWSEYRRLPRFSCPDEGMK